MYFKLRILSVLALLSLNCFAMESLDSSDEIVLFQEFGKEAQTELGIPEDQHAPIMALPLPKSKIERFFKTLFTNPSWAAAYFPIDHKILVNFLATNSKYYYGVNRCYIFHEAVHAKYQDGNKYQNNISIPDIERKNIERRADLEACYAIKCFLCLKEYSLRKNVGFDPNGYLTCEEVLHIADEFQKNNKICTYHKVNGSELNSTQKSWINRHSSIKI